MKALSKLFVWTVGSSFITSLSLGSLNIRIAGLSSSGNWKNLFYFIIAAAFTQAVTSRMILKYTGTSQMFEKTTKVLEVITILMMIFLSFRLLNQSGEQVFLPVKVPSNALVVSASAAFFSLISGTRICLWISWVNALKGRHLFVGNTNDENYYAAAIGVGALLAYFTYAFAGYYAQRHSLVSSHKFNLLIAFLLVTLAGKKTLHLFNFKLSLLTPEHP